MASGHISEIAEILRPISGRIGNDIGDRFILSASLALMTGYDLSDFPIPVYQGGLARTARPFGLHVSRIANKLEIC